MTHSVGQRIGPMQASCLSIGADEPHPVAGTPAGKSIANAAPAW
jgi:hypothetical protein